MNLIPMIRETLGLEIEEEFQLLKSGCPVCAKRTYTNFRRNYCSECGQAPDWSEDDGE